MNGSVWVPSTAPDVTAARVARAAPPMRHNLADTARTALGILADTLGNGWIWLVAAAIVIAFIRGGA